MAKKGSTRGSRFLVILIIASFLILGLHPQKNSFDVCYRIWQKKEKKLSLIPNGTHTSFLPPPHTVLMSRMSTCIYSYTYIHRHRAVPCQNLLSFSQNIFFLFPNAWQKIHQSILSVAKILAFLSWRKMSGVVCNQLTPILCGPHEINLKDWYLDT